MGARGPKPAPTHLKVLKGEQESRINREEPLPSEDELIVPEMSDGARAIWNELAPDLMDKGCLTPWDTHTFVVFCEAQAMYYECRKLLYATKSKFGKYVEAGAAGGVIKSPYHQMMRDCAETIAKFSSRFGLTPGDRANLRVGLGNDGPVHGAERILG
jgi:P27 family predicted phage terminase small subunit